MEWLHTFLIFLARVGIGATFLGSAWLDIKAKNQIFNMMKNKNVPMPWFFYIGAIALKIITSIGLIFNIHPVASAIFLALYILVANIIFNNFWTLPKGQRDFPLSLFLTHLASSLGLLAISVIA